MTWSFCLKAMNVHTRWSIFIKKIYKELPYAGFYFSLPIVHIKGFHAEGLHFLFFISN
jgi:hypothetical protein